MTPTARRPLPAPRTTARAPQGRWSSPVPRLRGTRARPACTGRPCLARVRCRRAANLPEGRYLSRVSGGAARSRRESRDPTARKRGSVPARLAGPGDAGLRDDHVGRRHGHHRAPAGGAARRVRRGTRHPERERHRSRYLDPAGAASAARNARSRPVPVNTWPVMPSGLGAGDVGLAVVDEDRLGGRDPEVARGRAGRSRGAA